MAKSYKELSKIATGMLKYKKKKEEEQPKAYKDIQPSNYDLSGVKKDLESKIKFDTLADDLASVSKGIGDAYSGWQTQEIMLNTRSSVDSMKSRLKALDSYQRYFGGKDKTKLREISNLREYVSSALDNWDKQSELYGNYKNADAFNVAKKNSQLSEKFKGLSYDEVQQEKKKYTADSDEYKFLHTYSSYNDLTDFDKALTPDKRAKELKNNIIKLRGEKTNVNGRSRGLATDIGGYNSKIKSAEDEYTKYLNSIGFDSEEDYDKYINNLETGRNTRKLDHSFDLFKHYADKKDFAEESKYVSTKGKYDGWFDKMLKGDYGLGYGDITYEYINNVDGIRDEIKTQEYVRNADISYNRGMTTQEAKGYDKLNPEEIATYNYIYKTEGKGKAQEFLDAMEMTLTKRVYDEQTGKWKNDVDSFGRGTFHSIMSIPASVIGAVPTLIDSIADVVQGKEYNPYSIEKYATNYASDVRKYVGENIAESTEGMELFGQNVPSFLYSTGMSIADNLVGATTLGSAYLPLMSTNAFHQKAKEMTEAGEDTGTIYATALASGIAEMVFEKVSLDNFLKIKNVGDKIDIVKNVLKQAGIEGSEELATEFANILSDSILRGSNSELNQLRESLAERGYTDKEINTEIAKKIGSQIGWATIGGMLSGGVMGGAGAVGNYAENSMQGADIRTKERVQDLIDLVGDESIGEAYETYTRYANKGVNAENIKDAQLGRLYNEALAENQGTLKSKKSTDEQLEKATGNLIKLSTIATDNIELIESKRKKSLADENVEKLNVGEQSDIDIKNVQIKDGKTLATTDKGEISVDDVTLSKNDADLIGYAQVIAQEHGDDLGNLYLSQYDGKTNLERYTNDFNLALNYSDHNYSFDYMIQNKGSLSATDISNIYKETVVRAAKERQLKIDKLNQKMADKKFYKGIIDESAISYDNKATNGQVNWKDLTPRQRQAVTFIKGLAKATGMNLKFIANNPEINGGYSKETNVLTINLDDVQHLAKGIQETIIPTMSHETTHWMKDKAPELWENLNGIVFNTLTEHYNSSELSGKDLKVKGELLKRIDGNAYKTYTDEEIKSRTITEKDLINAEIKRLKNSEKYKGKNVSEDDLVDEAREEIIARACEDILAMSEQGKKIFNSLSKDEQKTLAEKIKNLIKDLLNWIDGFLKESEGKATSTEAIIMRKYQDKLNETAKLWDKMLEQSVQANQSLEKSGEFNHDASAEADVRESSKIDRRRKTNYNEYMTNALKWARNTDRKVGDLTILNANGKYFALIEATEDGFIELSKGTYKEMKEEYEQAYKEANNEIYGNLEGYESDEGTDNWDMQFYEAGRNGNGNPQQTKSQRLQDNSTRNDEYLWHGNQGVSKYLKTTDEETLFKEKNKDKDIRFSEKDIDAEYIKAVEDGDTETVSRMVEEAAERVFSNSKVRGNDGKLRLVYHGRVSDFTVFDRQFANIEGDFGKGYYFTSNEYDVDSNYANEEGPDLKNKISLYAEQLEWQDEYSDLSYEEREEIARQKFITSEPNTITAYLNMENPVYITPNEQGTFLDFNEEYDKEYDEYGEPEGLLIDFIEALQDISKDYAYNDVDFSFIYDYADDGGVFAADIVKTIKHRIVDELTDDNGDLAVNEVIRLAFEQIGFDGIIDTSVYYKFRNMNGMDSGTTHYIVFNSNQIKSADLVTYDDDGNIIPLSERFNKENEDIRYSEKNIDSEGNTLTEEQAEFFKDSKIRDENGNLLVMYHGTPEDFTVFDKKKARASGTYGRGFYFTREDNHARHYGNPKEYYLKIDNPLSTKEKTITKPQLKKFLEVVAKDEDYGLENYGYESTVESVIDEIYDDYDASRPEYRKTDFSILQDINLTAIGNLVEAVELFNKVNGTNFDGFILPTETVIFNSEQAKLTSNLNPTEDKDIRLSEKDTSLYDIIEEKNKHIEKLEQDIVNLKERVKLEKKVTNGTVFNTNHIGMAASHLRKLANSDMDKVELMRELKDVYTYIRSGIDADNLTWNNIYDKAYSVAEKLVADSQPLTAVDDYAKGILRDLRNSSFSLDETQKREAKDIFGDHWNYNFIGNIKVSNDAPNIDAKWQEWSNLYPDVFSDDMGNNHIRGLYDVIESLRATSEYIDDYAMKEKTDMLAYEIYNHYWTISTVETTADKYTAKMKELDANHKKMINDLRKEYNEELENQRLADDIYYGKKLKELKDKDNKKLQEQLKAQREKQRAKQKELYQKFREKRNRDVAIAKQTVRDNYKESAERKTLLQSIMATTTSLNNKLQKNDKDVHIPETLKPVVINLINAIDYSSKQLLGMKGSKADMRGVPTKKDIALDKQFGFAKSLADGSVSLKQAMTDTLKLFQDAEKVANSVGDGTMDMSLPALDLDLINSIEKTIKSLEIIESTEGSTFVLNKMSNEQLKTLNATVKSINHWANQIDYALASEHKARISEYGFGTCDDVDVLGKNKEYIELVAFFKKIFLWSNLTPINAFERLGSYATKLFKSLQNAQGKLAHNKQDILDFTAKLFDDFEKNHQVKLKDIKKWRTEVKEFELKLPNHDTKTVKMPISYVMTLYCLAKQEDAQRHLLGKDMDGNQVTYEENGAMVQGGGMTIAPFKDGKITITREIRPTILTNDLIKQMTNTLTKEQIEMADALQKWMNTKGSEWGNFVSEKLYGIKKFVIENYFPISVSPTEITSTEARTLSGTKRVHFYSILNYGFTKNRNPQAKQSIEIGDIFEVFANHMSQVAIYNAYALPIFDIVRWYNFKGFDGKGKKVNVHTSIEEAFGTDAITYIDNLLSDLNGQNFSSRLGFVTKIFRNTKLAMVGNSISVALLQPTAYLKAMTQIPTRHLLKSLLYVRDFGARKGIQKAKAHCGIALWKSQGNYETDITPSMQTEILRDENLLEKLKGWSLIGAEKMDELTWGVLWNAVEFDVRANRKDLKVGSPEYFKTVADKLEYVIYKTQVVDSPLTRSDVMRSPDNLVKMLTMFGSEMTVAYNMVAESFVDAKIYAKKNGKGSWKRNAKSIGMTMLAYTLTSAASQLLNTMVQLMRDDEDKEPEEIMKMYFSNFFSDWLIFGKLPYVKEYLNYAQGYSASRPDTLWMESSIKAIKYFARAFDGDDTGEKAIKESLKALSYLSGLPGYNLYRDTIATLDTFKILDAEDFKEMLNEIFY